MPKRRHKEGNGSVSSSGESEAWPHPQESSRPPLTSQTASNVEEEGLLTERNPLDLEAPMMTSEIIQPETISSTNRNYSFYWKNQFEIPNFEGFNESLHISSEEDNPITPGQRPREVNTNNSTSMQPTVVLVQPVDDPTNKSFLSNEIKLAKALAASNFGNWSIDKINKNLGRNLLVVTMERHYDNPSELLKITEIGPWKVKYRLPASQSTSVGVIGPFNKDTSNEDLTEALKDAGFNGAGAERIFRARKKSKHQCLKSAPHCVVCTGSHTSNECNKTTGRNCCNCGGNHTANYGECPKMKQAKEVEKTPQIQKLSYRDAVKQVLKQTATPTSQPQSVLPANTILSRHQPDSGNLQILKTSKTKTVGTQTIDELQTPAQKHVTINQLLDLLIRIFTAASQKDVQMDTSEMPTVAVTTEEDMGSDHYPVVTSIGVAPSTAGFRKRPTWKFGNETWKNWTAALQQPELQGMDDLQREFTNFTMGGQQLEFTKQFKYLGGILDSPQLRWHHQVEYLKQSCAPLLNLLQSISHRHCSAARKVLICLYKTLIRSRLDYAAPLYGTAVLSNLLQLNSIQNHCLRIAAGCRKTSPAASLEFIPGHKGIPGNEAADEAAKNAHLLRYCTLTPSSYEEIKNLTNTAFKAKWKTEWLRSIQLTGKGRHLLKIRDNTGQWPWSAHRARHIETALARLRVGHTLHRAPVSPLSFQHCILVMKAESVWKRDVGSGFLDMDYLIQAGRFLRNGVHLSQERETKLSQIFIRWIRATHLLMVGRMD
ncbi:hypothetical protein FHG87_014563 [Trinorchestia longiramus]|nr:hypothetical protein FHG87_014563 [Trinorchestia longiramus]